MRLTISSQAQGRAWTTGDARFLRFEALRDHRVSHVLEQQRAVLLQDRDDFGIAVVLLAAAPQKLVEGGCRHLFEVIKRDLGQIDLVILAVLALAFFCLQGRRGRDQLQFEKLICGAG
jgi:hypothetical protein